MATYTTTGKQDCKTIVSDGVFEWELKKSGVFTSTAYTETVANGKAIGLDTGEDAMIDCDSTIQDYVPSMMLPSIRFNGNDAVYQGQANNYGSGVERFGLYIEGSLDTEWVVLSDYSGEDWDGSDKDLSCPINGHADARQIILASFFSNATRNISIQTD